MEDKKLIPQWLSVVLLVLIVGAFMLNVCTLTQSVEFGIMNAVVKVVFCVAYASSLLYFLSGYKKDAALYFHVTTVIYAVAFLVSILVRTYSGDLQYNFLGVFSTFVSLTEFGIMCIFAVAKDLGRKKSLTLAAINLVCAVLHVLSLLKGGLMIIAGVAGEALLAFILLIMLYAKYADKAQRGTK